MNPGLFDKRITFCKTEITVDDLLQEIEEFVEYATVWSMIRTLKSDEYYSAATTKNEESKRFIIRYRKGITSDMQIKYNEQLYDIKSIINDDEKDKTLTIIAETKVK